MNNKILLEELNRIKFISNYSLNKTSKENQKIILERGSFRDFVSTTRGSEVFRGEVESILKQGGLEIKTVEGTLGGGRTLTRASEILKAFKEGKLAEASIADLKSVMFKQTSDRELMKSIAHDIVYSEKFVEEYAHLSHSEIKDMLKHQSSMHLAKDSEQTRLILDAHDAKIAEDARKAEELRLRDEEGLYTNREPDPYRSEKEWKSYDSMGSERERVTEFRKRYPKKVRERQMKEAPKTFLENLKSAGLTTWKVGGWLIRNSIWILIFGGMAWAIVKNWSAIVNAFRGCGDGMVQDPNTGECVKGGTSSGDDDHDNRITDDQGNKYDPCSGVYKIGCVTDDGKKETGNDYISQAQECLGLSPTGMFNKELENKLYDKINKRSFSKADLSLICMAGGTLAAL